MITFSEKEINFVVVKEKSFETFVKMYDKNSQKIFLKSLQRYYKVITSKRYNAIMEADTISFQRLVFAIGASKNEDSVTVDFDGYLKIKYYFIDKQATEEQLKAIQEYDIELYCKYFDNI